LKILEKICIPKDNINDYEVIIKNIYVVNNDEVKENTLLLDYETSKANFEIKSNVSGYVKILCEENDKVKVGQEIIVITDEIEYQYKSEKKEINIKTNLTFSKKAQEMIDELNIDKQNFKDMELITEKIVLDYIENKERKNSHEKKRIAISSNKIVEIENLTNIKRNGLVSSVSKSFNSISIDTDTIYSRKEFKGSLSILIAKVVSDLLTTDDYRHLNSYVDGSYIYLYDKINFGFALNLGSGLKIGVVNSCNSMRIKEIENRMIELIDKYIDEKLGIDDVSGSTLVLTDLTDQGIDSFTPLITNNNSVMIGLAGNKNSIQNLIIAFDHRVTDGLEISKFLNKIISEMKARYPK
tara:strand:+ start:395 stop:1456 length:1062 start_codon:yes stop_codon:yes gene_type:complete